jgi:hypothetical protein
MIGHFVGVGVQFIVERVCKVTLNKANGLFNFSLPVDKIQFMLNKAKQFKHEDQQIEKECRLFTKACELITILGLHDNLVDPNDISIYTLQLQNASFNILEKLIDEISCKYPFVLVNHSNLISGSTVVQEHFSKFEEDMQNRTNILLDLIIQVREKVEDVEHKKYLCEIETNIHCMTQIDIEYHQQKLNSLLEDPYDEFLALKSALILNIDDLGLSEIQKEDLINFISLLPEIDYRQNIIDLNNFSRSLIEKSENLN